MNRKRERVAMKRRSRKNAHTHTHSKLSELFRRENQINESDNSKWQKFIAVTDYFVIVHFYTVSLIACAHFFLQSLFALKHKLLHFHFVQFVAHFSFVRATYLAAGKRKYFTFTSKITVISLWKGEREKISLIEMLTNQFNCVQARFPIIRSLVHSIFISFCTSWNVNS